MMTIVFIIMIIAYRLAACMRSTTVNLAIRARLAAKRAAVRLTAKRAAVRLTVKQASTGKTDSETSEQRYD